MKFKICLLMVLYIKKENLNAQTNFTIGNFMMRDIHSGNFLFFLFCFIDLEGINADFVFVK